ncbi:MAG TPA: glycosyltransferase family 39 protein [Syntrophorhabdaceae bacterium]|jgi:4-amino-4-deoxy-L-arabinose transferase-like glycosyltransferase
MAPIETPRAAFLSWLTFDPDQEIKRPAIILIFILSLALILRLAAAATMSAIDLDGTLYAQIGDAFSKGEVREALGGVFPPFYPFLIGLAHLIIPDLELAGTAVSLAAGLLLVYLSFIFFRRLIGDTKALYVAFFVALNPYLVKYSASVLTESIATVLVLFTVFAFYRSWTADSPLYAALSGFSLSLTYLTRPEYIAYSVPLCALFLLKKRFLHAFLFALFFAFLVGAYVYWMKAETGFWVVSKKAILAKEMMASPAAYHSHLLPVSSLGLIARYFPTVLYDVVNALLPHLLLLAYLGIARVDRRYAVLVLVLLFFHILVPSAVRASSKRFYVELIPLMLPFTVAGLSVFRSFAGRSGRGKIIYYLCIAGIVGFSLIQCVNPPSTTRGLNKEAGLYLGSRDPHAVVAAAMPLVPFYAQGEWRFLPSLSRGVDTCGALMEQLRSRGVDYVVTDEETEKGTPFVAGCVKPLTPFSEFRHGEEFVKLYRIRDK